MYGTFNRVYKVILSLFYVYFLSNSLLVNCPTILILLTEQNLKSGRKAIYFHEHTKYASNQWATYF